MSLDLGPLGDATVVADGDTWTLIFIRELRHAPAAVWAALTDPAQLDQWSPFATDRPLSTPGNATLTMIDGANRIELAGAVRLAEEPWLLEYTWGNDILRWELSETPGGTRLILRHTLADPGTDATVAAGWHLCLVVMERLLDGSPVGVIRGQDAKNYGWDELREQYGRLLKRD
jgi:uncharacterized protein YndB with AHSA1/START domain